MSSIKSSMGIEVGPYGFPSEGGLRIDQEIGKLRANVQQELTLINIRLNDDITASGSKIQEIVDATTATKMDVDMLRELVSYISGGYKKD
eukprot:6967595-Ditylum_brightwellii.AAC.1